VRAPSFRQVCQYTGRVAASIADQTLIAIGGHLDHRVPNAAFTPQTSAASSPLAADDPAAVLPPDAAAGSPNDGLREVCDLLAVPYSVMANCLRDIADDLDPPK
jgi:hypothetical protein